MCFALYALGYHAVLCSVGLPRRPSRGGTCDSSSQVVTSSGLYYKSISPTNSLCTTLPPTLTHSHTDTLSHSRYGSEEDVDPVIEEGEEWKGRPKLKATLRLYSFDFFRKVVSRHDTGRSCPAVPCPAPLILLTELLRPGGIFHGWRL